MANDCQPAISMPRRGIKIRLHCRRTIPTVRLGGERPQRGAMLLKSIWRRMRLKWLKMKYREAVRRLKEYHRKLIAEIVQASAYADGFHQRILMEASCAVPVMTGPSFNNFRCDPRARAVIW